MLAVSGADLYLFLVVMSDQKCGLVVEKHDL